MVVNSSGRNDNPGENNHPGGNNQLRLEIMEPQETPNEVLLEGMQEIDRQLTELFKRGEGLQELLEGLWDIQGD